MLKQWWYHSQIHVPNTPKKHQIPQDQRDEFSFYKAPKSTKVVDMRSHQSVIAFEQSVSTIDIATDGDNINDIDDLSNDKYKKLKEK